MATAGRILIIPKGNYNAVTAYKMLDLVFYKDKTWLAKKAVVGIEPSDANAEYWFKMVETNLDLSEENLTFLMESADGSICPMLMTVVEPNVLSYVRCTSDSFEAIHKSLEKVSDEIEALNTNLATKNLKTYVGYTQLGMTSANTLDEIMSAMPTASMLIGQIGAENSVLNGSLPVKQAGELTIKKSTSANRGTAEFRRYSANEVWTNAYIDGVFVGWEKIATSSVQTLSFSDVFTGFSDVPVSDYAITKRGKHIYCEIAFSGSVTSGSNAIKTILNIKSGYRPLKNYSQGVIINKATSGQVYAPATAFTQANKSQVAIVFPEASKQYGNSSYPWCTESWLKLDWEIE